MTTLVDRDYQYSNLGMVSSLSKGVHSSLAAGVAALDYSFSYDDKGRLSGSTLATGGSNIYEMTMGYNAAGGITSKGSDRPGGHPLVDPNLDYELSYTYNPSKPHQLLSVSDAGPNGGLTNFTYDGVGNLINMSGPSGTEELIWNELQQLSGVKNGSGIHHYVYDHSGERIMKSSINRSSVQVNDQTIDDIQYLEPYTLYVNPYFVVTSFHNGDRASKHYYMNTQRVATDISINYQGPPPPAAPGAQGAHNGTQAAPIGLSKSLEQDINQVLHQFGAGEISGALSEDGIAIETYYPQASTESESTNRILYWYHPDYLGSVDLVTDRNGVAYEFFLYTPWGEDMYHYNAGQSSFTSPYRFNGKEKDPETGYHYYGARYYQSKFSVWMSVDPLAHETLEPYVYTGNNPVMLVDPDGRSPWEPLGSNPLIAIAHAFQRVAKGFGRGIDSIKAKFKAAISPKKRVGPGISLKSTMEADISTQAEDFFTPSQGNHSVESSPFTGNINLDITLDITIGMGFPTPIGPAGVSTTTEESLLDGGSQTTITGSWGNYNPGNGIFIETVLDESDPAKTRGGVRLTKETPEIGGWSVEVQFELSAGSDVE